MEKRIVEVLKESGWEKIDGLINVKKDDVFRMSEEDGKFVVDNDGRKIFKAKSDAFVNQNNVATVEFEPYLK